MVEAHLEEFLCGSRASKEPQLQGFAVRMLALEASPLVVTVNCQNISQVLMLGMDLRPACLWYVL